MAWFRHGGYLLSAGAHVAVFAALFVMKKPDPTSQNVAVVMSQTKMKEKPKKEPPPKPIEAPKETLQRPLARKSAPPPPVAALPPDPIAAAHPQLAQLPDFGINLSGGGPGGGLAIPMGGGAPTPAAAQPVRKEKVLGAAAERPAAAGADDSEGELVKAKVSAPVQPTYTDDARAAGIEGRVVVEVSLDETGEVTSVRVVRGLGHGLDESAIAAAKRMKFSPATRGGKPVKSTFMLSLRFVLGD